MENSKVKFCQSCAMPVENADLQGTNGDGSRSEDYCVYCFKDGAFTKDETMEEMIESCVPFVSKGEPWPNEEIARKAMKELFPQLKRWKNA
jgi:hypothetical protein